MKEEEDILHSQEIQSQFQEKNVRLRLSSARLKFAGVQLADDTQEHPANALCSRVCLCCLTTMFPSRTTLTLHCPSPDADADADYCKDAAAHCLMGG
jgi:hypothetical protein